MYQFENFDNVDMILDVLFKLLNSSALLDYAIAIQIGGDLNQIGKLIELEQKIENDSVEELPLDSEKNSELSNNNLNLEE